MNLAWVGGYCLCEAVADIHVRSASLLYLFRLAWRWWMNVVGSVEPVCGACLSVCLWVADG
jgi:hypothetical protein